MIELLSSGFYTSIQDLGRFEYTHFGVPLSGAMDQKLSAFSNLLVGNDKNTPVIEMTFAGPKIKFKSSCIIALTAVNATGTLNDEPLIFNKQIGINKDDILQVHQIETRAYMSIKGGFKIEKSLGSYSQYQGVTKTQKLSKGDTLQLNSPDHVLDTKHAGVNIEFSRYRSETIEVFRLPEYDLLSDTLKTQLQQNFSVSSKSNRMAYQLDEHIENQLEGIRSKPILPGTVQLTPQGNLMILMRDAQVTGGYPRIFQLTENSINILAQKPPKAQIKFKMIDF